MKRNEWRKKQIRKNPISTVFLLLLATNAWRVDEKWNKTISLTYRTVIEWCPTHCNGRKARWLWASRLYVTYTICTTRTVHINGWTWWICSWKTASCCCCMRWCWRSIALGCCGRCLIIVHNCNCKNRWTSNEVFLIRFFIHPQWMCKGGGGIVHWIYRIYSRLNCGPCAGDVELKVNVWGRSRYLCGMWVYECSANRCVLCIK